MIAPQCPYVSVQHARRIISLCAVRGMIGFIMRSAFPFPTQDGKVVRAPLLETDAAARPVHPSSTREIVSIAPRNEVTMRVIICMSRLAMLRCNEELWRNVGKTSTEGVRISGDYDRIELRARCIDRRRDWRVLRLRHDFAILFFFFALPTGATRVNVRKRLVDTKSYRYRPFKRRWIDWSFS